ncbi:MAG: dethiobiotin synthase [Pseudomonadota bacterium]|nr:dethiobiotin synthase [Pseudomonadota bacterium]
MKQGYFVTGTDTGVGKTLVSAALLHSLGESGLSVCGMKPVASGCIETLNGLRNDDADRLIDASNVSADYDLICPYRFLPPIAPHIAAQQADIVISTDHIVACYQRLESSSDAVVVEGVGGWQVPLDEQKNLSDLAIGLDLPVIIVVGARLGCINHALLTAESVLASGLTVAGWVFNQIDPDLQQVVTVKETLQSRIPGCLIADIPWQENPDVVELARNLDSSDLMRNT